jgi:putative DNA primase/helicase
MMDGGFPDMSAAKAAMAANELLLYPGAPLVSARKYLRLHHTKAGLRTLHHQNATFYQWAQTHYIEATTEEVRANLYGFLDQAVIPTGKEGETVPFAPTKAKVGNVLEALAAEAQLPYTVKPPSWLDGEAHLAASDLISCANGLLHPPTRTVLPHSPAFFSLNAVEFGYQSDAAQPVE